MTKTLLTLFAALSLCVPVAAAPSGGKKPAAAPAQAAKEDKGFAKDDAIAAAERFIAAQGYTAEPATVSKDAVVPDPFDGGKDPDTILKTRRGALEPKAVGARFDSDFWFVGFRIRAADHIRGVRMDSKGGNLKVVSQSMRADWLAGNDPKPQPLTKDEAKAIAKRFIEAEGARGLAKEPSQADDHQPDGKDSWDAWWFTFPKAEAGKGGELKPGEYALVSVHKLSRDPKWVVELKGPAAAAPKPAAKPAVKPAPKTPAKPAPAPKAQTKSGKKAGKQRMSP